MKTARWSTIPAVLLCVLFSLTSIHAGSLEQAMETGARLPMPDVQFKLKVMGLLELTGRFRDVTGSLVRSGTEDDLSADITVATNSVNTRNPAVDHFLRSADFFHVDRYPVIRFEGVRLATETIREPQLVGNLTLNGQRRRVAFDVVRVRGDRCKWSDLSGDYAASATISRAEFGLDGLEMIASDKVEITVCIGDKVLDLLANPTGPCQQCGAHLNDRSFESAPYAGNF